MKKIIFLFILGLVGCSTKKIVFSNNPYEKSDICLFLADTDKLIYFNTSDLLQFKNIRPLYDSSEIKDFRDKAAAIFKTRSDTIWMWKIMGDFYVFKDTSKIVYSDSINSDIFDDLLFDLLINKKANMTSKNKSNFLILKTNYSLFLTAKYKSIYDPDNRKEYLVRKEIWRRKMRHDAF